MRRVALGKGWRKSLDDLCRQVVFARDKATCQWCNRKDGQLHWAHIRSRRYLSTRWHLDNSLVLDAGCHLRFHHEPMLAAVWFKGKFPDRDSTLNLYARGLTGGKIDREAIRLGLEQELRGYE